MNTKNENQPQELSLESLLVGIPTGIPNMRLPDPSLRDYYLDEENRILWLDTSIEENVFFITKAIFRYNRDDEGIPVEERKRILLMIDSGGGMVQVGQSIIGAMEMSKTPVDTCVYCVAYSMAADIFACGARRYMFPFTSIMFHSGSAAYQGTQSQVDSAKTFMDRELKRLFEKVMSKTSFDTKMKNKIKREDVFLNEEEALKWGVADKIVTSFDELF